MKCVNSESRSNTKDNETFPPSQFPVPTWWGKWQKKLKNKSQPNNSITQNQQKSVEDTWERAEANRRMREQDTAIFQRNHR